MAEFRRVEPTDLLRIPAGDWNAAMRQVEAAHGQRHGTSRQAIDRDKDGDKCLVRNETGMDLDRFSVVGLSDPIILPSANLQEFKRQVTFRGVVPNESHQGRFAVLLAPCAAGAITEAAIAGVTWVWLQVDDPLDGCADVLPGSTDYLVTSPTGSAQVLWRESDSGVCWAAIRFGTICNEDWSEESSWSDDSSSSDESSFSEDSSSRDDSSSNDESSFSDDSNCPTCQGITDTVDVLIPEPSRDGDNICFPKLRLQFCDGLFVGSLPLGKTCVYVCCDDSSSSWDDFIIDLPEESSDPLGDSGVSMEDSSIPPYDSSSLSDDSSLSLEDSNASDDSSSVFEQSIRIDESSSLSDSSSLTVLDDSSSSSVEESSTCDDDSWSDNSSSDDSSSSSF